MGEEKILFVCWANRNRSVAAERVCRRLAKEKGMNIRCESVGVDMEAERPVTKEIADRAGRIYVMEEYMKEMLVEQMGQGAKKIESFDIPDIYVVDDPRLEEILTEKIEKVIETSGVKEKHQVRKV